MNQNVKYLIDFIVNLDYDKSQLNSLAKVISDTLGKIAPDIDFGGKEGIKNVLEGFMDLQNEAIKFDKALDAIDIEGFEKDMDKALSSVEKSIEELNDIDINIVDKIMDDMPQEDIDKLGKKFSDAFNNFDTKKFNQEVGKLAAEFDKAKQETEQLIKTQKSAQAAMAMAGKEGTDEYKKLENQIAEAEQQLKKMEKASSQGTAATKTSLGDKLFMFSNFANTVQQLTSTTEQFMQPFEELDKQVRNIGTLGVKNFQEFADAATELSETVPDSAGQIAQGVYEAISAGTIKVKNGVADVAEGMKFVEIASKLATAGLTTTQDSINGLTSVMNAYHLEANQAAEVSDIFFGAVNVGKTTIPELNASLSQVIPEAAKLNISFTHIAASLATMTKQGTPTTQATNQLRAAFIELEKPGTDLSKILDKANISYKNLSTEGPQETFRKLVAEIEKTGQPMAKFFSSMEASSAISLLAGKNAQMAADDYEAVKNSVGATNAAFDIASEGIGAKSKIMMNNIQAGFNNLIETTGGAEFLSITTKLAPLMTTFTGLAMAMPSAQTIKNISQTGMSILSKLVPALVTQTVAQEGATVAQMKFNVAALANPYVLGIAGIIALVAGLAILTNALHKTAEEQLDDTKALKENTDTLIRNKQTEAASIESKKKMAEGLIKTTKDTSELTKKVNEYDGELKKLKKDIFDLEGKRIDIELAIKKLEADVEIEKFKEDLSKQLEPSQWSGPFQVFENEFWGTLFSGKSATDRFTKEFTKGLEGAKSSAEIKSAIANMEKKILESDEIDEQVKLKQINRITAIGNKEMAILEQRKVGMEKDYNRFIETGSGKQEALNLVAKKYHTNQAEVDKVIKKEQESKAQIDKNVGAVGDLVKKWQDVNNELSKSINDQVTKINGLKLAKKDGEKIDEKELENGKKNLKVLADRKKVVDKINEATMKESGLSQVQAISSLDKAQKLFNSQKEKLELQNQALEIDLQGNANAEKRKLDAVDELLIAKQRLDSQKQELVYAEQIFSSKLKEKPEVQKVLSDIKKQIADSKANILKLEAEVSPDALIAVQNELAMRQWQLKLEVGIEPKVAVDEMVKIVQSQISALRQKQNAEDDKANAEIEIQVLDKQKQIADILKSYSDKIIADIKEKSDKEIELTNKKYDILIESAKRFTELYRQARANVIDDDSKSELEALQKTQDARMTVLDRQKEAELISQAEYDSKKNQLQEKFNAEKLAKDKELADKKAAQDNLVAGMEAELQRKKDSDLLKQQKSAQEEELKILQAKTDPSEPERKRIAELTKTLDDTNKVLSLKAEETFTIFDALGTSVGDALTGMFAGDEGAWAENSKKYFEFIIGVISKQLEAFIMTQLLSESVSKWMLALPFPLNLVMLPVAKTMISGLVHSIADPVLNSIASFATGGDITPLGRYDSPTRIQVGDASKYGGLNREWVTNDTNIKQIVQMAINSSNSRLENLLMINNQLLSELSLETTLKGSDFKIAMKRLNYLQSKGSA